MSPEHLSSSFGFFVFPRESILAALSRPLSIGLPLDSSALHTSPRLKIKSICYPFRGKTTLRDDVSGGKSTCFLFSLDNLQVKAGERGKEKFMKNGSIENSLPGITRTKEINLSFSAILSAKNKGLPLSRVMTSESIYTFGVYDSHS